MTEMATGLLDDPVMVMWFLVAAGFGFLAGFALRVWVDVGGIRGLATVTLMASCGLLAMLLGVAHSPYARIPWEIILVLLRPLFTLMLLSAMVIVDIYGSDHNDHRSVTTIIYQWFKRMTYERNRKNEKRRTEIHEGGKL